MAVAKKSQTKKAVKVKSLILQPYGIELIVSNDWVELCKYLKKKYEFEPTSTDHGVSGLAFSIEMHPTGEIKFIQYAQDEQTLVHECVHSAFHILDHVGVKLKANNHEALAYTVDWIFGECKKWLT